MLCLFYFGYADELQYLEGGQRTRLAAVSGGGRGQKRDGVVKIYGDDGALKATQRDWRVQSVGKPSSAQAVRGGPIPPGQYRVGARPAQPHKTFGADCAPIELTMLSITVAKNTGRVRGTVSDGRFYIHGRGQLGSDGCIVPARGNETLLPLLDALDRQGGGLLRVVQSPAEARRLIEGRVGEDDWNRLEANSLLARTA